jgi:hypothetical protein
MKITVKKVYVVEIHTAKLQPINNLLKESIKYDTMILVHWTYTAEEWKAFLQSSKKRSNIFHRLFHFLMAKSIKSAPSVRITPEKVWIGNDQQHFSSGKHELRQIDLKREGAVNILSIAYGLKGGHHEIRIPVPKGKLREAIEVQEQIINQLF